MKTKFLLLVLSLSVSLVACTGAEEKTEEQETTNMQDEMKTVQPVVDSAYEAAAEGDSSLLKDDKPNE